RWWCRRCRGGGRQQRGGQGNLVPHLASPVRGRARPPVRGGVRTAAPKGDAEPVTAAPRGRLPLPTTLTLTSGAPPERRGRRTRPAGRGTGMCGVFRGGRMPPRKIPPAPRTRCAAPGAQAGCVSLRQVSLHKQRKVARAVTARKLLILMSGEPEQQAGQDPPYNPSQRPT